MISRIKKARLKTTLILVILLLIVSLGIYSYYTIGNNKYPIINNKLESKDYDYVLKFYSSNKPLLEDRPFYGEENAQLTLVIYSTNLDENSKEFMTEVFPVINEEYVKTGKLKVYQKYNINAMDYKDKTDKYKYAQTLLCVEEYYPEVFWSYYFNSFNNTLEDNFNINNIDSAQILECVNQEHFERLLEDLSESQKFRIQDINPVLYVGIGDRNFDQIIGNPTFIELQRVIRQKQLAIGD